MEKEKEKRKMWSAREEQILSRWYSRAGGRKVQQILANNGFNRTYKSILLKAQRLMLYRDPPEGYISIYWASRARGDGYYRILYYACKDGVLLTREGGRVQHFVPIEWAEKMFIKPVEED